MLLSYQRVYPIHDVSNAQELPFLRRSEPPEAPSGRLDLFLSFSRDHDMIGKRLTLASSA